MAKINSKSKGNRAELELAKMLTARFGKSFSRSVGSGNRWAQVGAMPAHAQATLLGDLCCPEGFLWVIECKSGYQDGGFEVGPSAVVDAFIAQAEEESLRSGRKPLICWKRPRRPWVALVRSVDLPGCLDLPYRLIYRGWLLVPLVGLLEAGDEWWFQ